MKKRFIMFTVITVLLAAVFGVFGATVIHKAYQNQVQTVENIAGAVLSSYPQAEQKFIEALLAEGSRDSGYGQSILSRYGYDADMGWNRQYKQSMLAYLSITALLAVCVLSFGYTIFAYARKNRRKQEKQLLKILDCCLSGDYRFINDQQRLNALDNPYFADSLVKLGESLRLKTEYLDQEHDHTKTLVTDISHQLKTPISAMKACFAMYLEADSEKERTEFLERSKIQMDKLEALTASLIHISRLESNLITLNKTDTLLTEILVGAINTVYHKALKKNITIETADFTDIHLQLDAKWTVEAIANILDNAVKYSPANSRIQIRAQRLYSFVRIEIEDQGIGISKAEQNNIFRRFYRGENNTVKNQEGSGVGLYLARSILEEQGGTVSVRAQVKGGSVFIIQLPL